MKVDIKMTGHKEIDEVLKGLPLKLSHQVISAANASAAKPLIEAEKLSAPEGPTGNLVDSIGAVKTPIKRANVIGEVTVGPRRHGRFKGHAAHLIEEGTAERQNRKGANRGRVLKKPFLYPAFVKTKQMVLSRIDTELGRKVWSFMKRTIKNG